MSLLLIQILIINLLVSGVITAGVYIFKKSVRGLNPLIIFMVSSLGTFIGSMLGVFLPSTEGKLLNSLIVTAPGIFLSLLFIIIWIKGLKSESYF